jgi:hypothetical protein
MKKIILTTILLVSVCTACLQAQDKTYGFRLSPLTYNSLNETLKSNSQSFKSSYNPAMEAAFIYRFKALELLLNVKYAQANFESYKIKNNSTGLDDILTINAKFLSSILKLNYLWYQKNRINFFSGLGAGIATTNINSGNLESAKYFNNDFNYLNGFAYQLDIIGVDYRFSKNFSITSVIGYGTNGYTQLGLTYAISN